MSTTLSHNNTTTKLPAPPTGDVSSVLIKAGAFVGTAAVAGGLWIMMS